MRTNALVPGRFLTLSAHVVLLVTLLWVYDENVRACLPRDFSEAQYAAKSTEIIVGLSLGLVLAAFELVGFLTGVSMFFASQALISTAAHCAATVALAYFVVDLWNCSAYWWIFVFCSVLPAFAELCVVIGVVCLKKVP
nr:transmembrane protein 107-like [Dermacentor andersoni]